MTSDYIKFRGKCKEESEKLCANDPTLRLVRGYYHCLHTGKNTHWWCQRGDEIIDPTVKQFSYPGTGEYEEFDGVCTCDECGKVGGEDDFIFEGRCIVCPECRCAHFGVDRLLRIEQRVCKDMKPCAVKDWVDGFKVQRAS